MKKWFAFKFSECVRAFRTAGIFDKTTEAVGECIAAILADNEYFLTTYFPKPTLLENLFIYLESVLFSLRL